MDARQLLSVELLADPSGFVVADLQRERDCLGNHVIGRQQMVGKPEISERAKDSDDARMVRRPLF
ncbi:MAG: hypothetical protein HY657_16715 [Acidobacteria bacterium]|nr:hypothetical protein [Acidobacteriota bacterium]